MPCSAAMLRIQLSGMMGMVVRPGSKDGAARRLGTVD
jgi:hypothetical protein